jgi:hypothetical protein
MTNGYLLLICRLLDQVMYNQYITRNMGYVKLVLKFI